MKLQLQHRFGDLTAMLNTEQTVGLQEIQTARLSNWYEILFSYEGQKCMAGLHWLQSQCSAPVPA